MKLTAGNSYCQRRRDIGTSPQNRLQMQLEPDSCSTLRYHTGVPSRPWPPTAQQHPANSSKFCKSSSFFNPTTTNKSLVVPAMLTKGNCTSAKSDLYLCQMSFPQTAHESPTQCVTHDCTCAHVNSLHTCSLQHTHNQNQQLCSTVQLHLLQIAPG